VTADWARPVVHWEIVAADPERQANSTGAMQLGGGEGPSWASRPDWADRARARRPHPRRGATGVILYVQVRDLVASLVLAAELGATVVLGPFDVPGGPTLAAIEDLRATPSRWSSSEGSQSSSW